MTWQRFEGLAVKVADLDLGDVWEAKAFACQVPVFNHTASEIAVSEFAVSCGCLEVEPKSLVLPPGGSEVVHLKIDLTRRALEEVGLAERPFAVDMRPVLKATPSREPSWRLHGRVRSRITLNTLALEFGEAPIQGQPPVSRKVVATLHVPVSRLEAAVDRKVAVQIRRQVTDPNRFDVLIAPRPELPTGPFETELTLTPVTASGGRLPGMTLPVSGNLQPEVRALPASMFLPTTPVGQTATAVVVLQTSPGASVEVDHIEADSPAVKVEPCAADGSSEGRAYRVSLRVSREGEQSSTVRFILRKPGGKLVPLSMQVSCRGESGSQPPARKGVP